MTKLLHTVSVLFIVAVTAVASFLYPQAATCRTTSVVTQQSTILNSWLSNSLNQVGKFFEDQLATNEELDEINPSTKMLQDDEKVKKSGRVIRTAARVYDKDTSKPSSRDYTTRKNAQSFVTISAQGVEGDHNYYRTMALQSTPDRAVSILTSDAMKFLRSIHPSAQDGDLGENLFVEGIEYRSFQVGEKVSIGDEVLLEITEPIEPCANLCKLPYINDESLNPKQRIKQCQTLIQKLDVFDGLRGWYAKVVQPGTVRVGDVLQLASSQ
jgi:MOSC domain-containing protein YiiM